MNKRLWWIVDGSMERFGECTRRFGMHGVAWRLGCTRRKCILCARNWKSRIHRACDPESSRKGKVRTNTCASGNEPFVCSIERLHNLEMWSWSFDLLRMNEGKHQIQRRCRLINKRRSTRNFANISINLFTIYRIIITVYIDWSWERRHFSSACILSENTLK